MPAWGCRAVQCGPAVPVVLRGLQDWRRPLVSNTYLGASVCNCAFSPNQDLIEHVVAVAENTADELARSDGREVQLEEDPDLQLPFLLPEDGYSCDVVRNLPNGLQEFLDPLCQRGEYHSRCPAV